MSPQLQLLVVRQSVPADTPIEECEKPVTNNVFIRFQRPTNIGFLEKIWRFFDDFFTGTKKAEDVLCDKAENLPKIIFVRGQQRQVISPEAERPQGNKEFVRENAPKDPFVKVTYVDAEVSATALITHIRAQNTDAMPAPPAPLVAPPPPPPRPPEDYLATPVSNKLGNARKPTRGNNTSGAAPAAGPPNQAEIEARLKNLKKVAKSDTEIAKPGPEDGAPTGGNFSTKGLRPAQGGSGRKQSPEPSPMNELQQALKQRAAKTPEGLSPDANAGEKRLN